MTLPNDASSDQSNCPSDYYRRSNGMLHQIPSNSSVEASNAITEDVLATLHTLDADALRSLVQRVGGAMWGIGLKTEEETAEAMLLRIAVNGLTSRDAKTTLENINAWLDRKQGKSVQRIDQRVLHAHKGIAGDMTNDELTQAIRGIKHLPPGIKLLEDGTLDVVTEDITVIEN